MIFQIFLVSLDAWGARPARKAGRSYVVPTAWSLRNASRAPLRPETGKPGCVFGESPNTAVETTALPTNRISVYSRLLAFDRDCTLPFFKVQYQLTQVVDFHESFSYS